jgi:hypothetical protein
VVELPTEHEPMTITRQRFLQGLVAGVVGAAAGPTLLSAPALAQTGTVTRDLSALDLSFSVTDQFRAFDLLGRDFVQLRTRFGGGVGRDLAARALTADATTVEEAGEDLRVGGEQAFAALFRTGVRPVAPYASVIADVRGSAGGAAVLVGLVRGDGDAVVAAFDAGEDPANGTVTIEVTVGGVTTVAATGTADLRGPARFAFSVQENFVTALVGRVANWVPVAQARVTDLVDLRDPAVLAAHDYGFGGRGDGATVTINGLEAGYFGQAGLRDPHVVQYADGTPYIRDGLLYFTATQAGLSFFQAAHWGVWTMDLAEPSRIRQVANLFFSRDGVIVGDHAGQIVLDDREGGFHIANSGWGDFSFDNPGPFVHYVRTDEEILSGVHVLASERLPLPTELESWDPAMTRIGDTWYVGFVESPYQVPGDFNFYPALAKGRPGGPITELELVGRDSARDETEGIILQKIGGEWYLLASDGNLRQYPVYDLELNFLGNLDAPYGTNIPHPQIVPIPDRRRTYYLMITFEGTQYYEPVLGYGTHGDLIVMRAAEERRGYEFRPRRA